MIFQGPERPLFTLTMSLEEEIQQKEFRNEYQRTAINLIFTTNWIVGRQQNFFNRFNITPKQYNVLRILKGQYPGSISTCDIRARMLDKNSDASRIVDRLAHRELVTKQVCPTDKRLIDVMISDKGLQVLGVIEDHIKELDNITQSLTESEARDLNKLLDKLRS